VTDWLEDENTFPGNAAAFQAMKSHISGEQKQLHRDLRASEQRLEAFKTQHPNATAPPLHERQLDRLNRPARVREPGPPILLDR
jgi:hypothetical protein